MDIHAQRRRKVWAAGLLAMLFTAMQITGYRIAMHYHTTVHRSALMQRIGVLTGAQCVVAAVLVFIVAGVVLYGLFTLSERITVADRRSGGGFGWGIWGATALLLFICWMPCFLASYPGYYNYDAFTQVPEALYEEVPYTAHHPLLHTLLMGKIIAFGYHMGTELNDGIALYSVFQMAVCALAFAYVTGYLWRRTGRRLLCAAAFVWYAFFPPIAMFAMSTTKDVLFSVCLLLTVVFLYEMCRDMSAFWASRTQVCRLAVMATLMCLLRKNGVYALVCVVPFVVWHYGKYGKRLLLLFAGVVLLYGAIDRGLVLALRAEEGSAVEMLSVPMQQLARVYHDHGESAFTEEELEKIYAGIGREQLRGYDPFLADHIKNHFDYELIREDKAGWLSLWIAKGIRYPGTYLQAFLDNTYQAWYPGTSVYSAPKDKRTAYFDMGMWPGGYRDSKAPKLLEFYRRIAEEFSYQKIPVVRLLFSIGGMLWAALFVWSFAMYRRNRPLASAMLLTLLYCATLLLGPVSLVRYYLILFYGLPLHIGWLFAGREDEAAARVEETGGEDETGDGNR
ncbi:MAG: DUF6020 family protein [Clostridium sp.]|nr:DUF6020 family protein [Acetatifactor muris]MCM1526880.1 DUF6020 family protein [Bacteroides sp.]MCM1563327.1 DUF6020 family protein [Clostridium sp.]